MCLQVRIYFLPLRLTSRENHIASVTEYESKFHFTRVPITPNPHVTHPRRKSRVANTTLSTPSNTGIID